MLVSELLAIAAAACLAMSGMLVNELKGRVDVFRFARWNMLAAFAMTGAVSAVVGGWRTLAPWPVGLLAASSLFGIIVASTTYFSAIYSAGPRITALLFSLTAPFAAVLGYVALGETISLRQGLGIAVVLGGVVLAVGPEPRRRAEEASAGSRDKIAPARPSWGGIALGVVTALGQALGGLLARPAMAAGVEPFTAMAVRAGVAAIFFVAIQVLPIRGARRPYAFSVRDFGIGAAASFFGTGLGMSLVMAALAHGSVGIVSTLSSMTPVVILPMVWIRSGRAPARRAWLGALLAVAGTALISVG